MNESMAAESKNGGTTPHRYKLLQDWTRGGAKKGDLVYSALGCDYGLARADWRATGQEHTSVSKNPSGECDGFTIPINLLEDLEPRPKVSVSENIRAFLTIGWFDLPTHLKIMDCVVAAVVVLIACLAIRISSDQTKRTFEELSVPIRASTTR